MAVTTEQRELMTAPVRENIKPYLSVRYAEPYPPWLPYTISTENIKSLTIERVGDETKFFGYGIVQKTNVKLIGFTEEFKNQKIHTASEFYVKFDVNGEAHYFAHSPSFRISEVHRDEYTGELSVTAYDRLYGASTHTIQEAADYAGGAGDEYVNYTIEQMVSKIAFYLGFDGASLPVRKYAESNSTYQFPAFQWNLDGTETLRDILDDIAEVYHAVYYATVDANGNDIIKFKQFKGQRVNHSAEYTLEVTKDDYFTLDTQYYRTMGQLTHVTALGNNITADGITGSAGTHIFIRDNNILSLMDEYEVGKYLRVMNYNSNLHYSDDYYDVNIPHLEYNLMDLALGQFRMSWRGNPWLEIGDIIKIQKKEEYSDIYGSYGNVYGYVLNDVIEYDGALKQTTQWNYKVEDSGVAGNPATLGEALKYTYANVDKVNQNITQVVQTQDEHKNQITSLVTEAGNISASVTTIQNGLEETMEGINGQFDTLTKKVEAAVTEDDVRITIDRELSNGVDKVATSTGFVFDEEGLNISKNTSEMATTITEDGMRVYRSGTEVLTANNEGVKAEDLHATTYLIIGNNSRFEDMGSDRTACFWIGGQ